MLPDCKVDRERTFAGAEENGGNVDIASIQEWAETESRHLEVIMEGGRGSFPHG